MKNMDPNILREIEKQRQKDIKNIRKTLYFGDEEGLDDSIKKSKITSQAETLSRMLNGENVYIGGPAGSGKSSVVKKFVKLIELESEGEVNIALTASTGMAASLIEGQTIHSWAGLGISTDPFDPKDIPGAMWAARKKMEETDILIIDEVSMIPLYLFEKLSKVLQWVKRNKDPFGGVQLILLGDFMQLPPVNRDPNIDARFAVFSEDWKNLDLKYCYLDRLHRARDKKLLYVLNSIAADKVNEKTTALLDSRMVTPDITRDYTKLYTTNRNVDKENEEMLEKNPNPSKTYKAFYDGDTKKVQKLFRTRNIPRKIELKKDAIVLLTKNRNTSRGFYPNGAVGRVVSMGKDSVKVKFSDGEEINIERTVDVEYEKKQITYTKKDGTKGKKNIKVEVASISYLPLKLGYAITVHKSQGTTLDSVQADLSNCFTPGLGYVALSRVRSLDDLVLLNYNDDTLKISPISAKVSRVIRNKARKDREKLEGDKEFYNSLLKNARLRSLKWGFDYTQV